MFAQLANTILHGVRIFDEAAKNTTPACLWSNKRVQRHHQI